MNNQQLTDLQLDRLRNNIDYMDSITTRAQIEADIREGARCPIHEAFTPCALCKKGNDDE